MKREIFFLLILSIVLSAGLTDACAQYQPHTQLRLPKGTKARFGKGSIQAIAYSPDGTRLAAATDIGIWIYDAQNGKALNLLARDTGYIRSIFSVVYSPDGRTIASGGFGHWEVNLWDATTGRHKAILKAHTERVFSIVYSPDGTTIASASRDETVRLWDAATGKIKPPSEDTRIMSMPWRIPRMEIQS